MKHDTPSSTALAVCAGTLAYGLTHPGSVDSKQLDLYASAMRAASPVFYFFAKFMHAFGLLKLVIRIFEFFTVRGINEHFVVRKNTIRGLAEDVAPTCEQVVILGGGYDFLAQHLAEKFPHLKVFETDHPATQRIKKQAITLLPANVLLVAVDYTKTNFAAEIKKISVFEPNKRTLLLAEGLFMYLTEEQIAEVFKTRAELFAPLSPFIFTTMVKSDVDHKIRFQTQSSLLDFWMNLQGEPFLWGLTRAEIPGFVSKKNCNLVSIHDHTTMGGKSPAQGEIVVRIQ